MLFVLARDRIKLLHGSELALQAVVEDQLDEVWAPEHIRVDLIDVSITSASRIWRHILARP